MPTATPVLLPPAHARAWRHGRASCSERYPVRSERGRWKRSRHPATSPAAYSTQHRQEAVPHNFPAAAGLGPQSRPTVQPIIGILGSLGAHDSADVQRADVITPGSPPPSPGPPSGW